MHMIHSKKTPLFQKEYRFFDRPIIYGAKSTAFSVLIRVKLKKPESSLLFVLKLQGWVMGAQHGK